jgi:hypothetical protein
VSRSAQLIESIFDLYEEASSPDALEPRDDMLRQIATMQSEMEPGEKKDFAEFVRWFGQQRYGISGNSPEDILNQMHPWQLQLVVQKFKTPGYTPEETPGE